MQKARIKVESKHNSYILQPQFHKGKDWEDLPKKITVPRAKFHGLEVKHMTNKRITRAKKIINKWFGQKYSFIQIEEIKPKPKKPKPELKEKKDPNICEKCGRQILTIGPFNKRCVHCRHIPNKTPDELAQYYPH